MSNDLIKTKDQWKENALINQDKYIELYKFVVCETTSKLLRSHNSKKTDYDENESTTNGVLILSNTLL